MVAQRQIRGCGDAGTVTICLIVGRIVEHRRWGADCCEMFARAHLAVADLFPHVDVPCNQRREHAQHDDTYQWLDAARRPATKRASLWRSAIVIPGDNTLRCERWLTRRARTHGWAARCTP